MYITVVSDALACACSQLSSLRVGGNICLLLCCTVEGGSGVEVQCASAVEFDSFAALIQATKERDAARKAKQQQAQLATSPSDASDAGPAAAEAALARAAVPQALDHCSDQGNLEAANGQPGRVPERQSLGSGTQQAVCPAHVQPLGKLKPARLSDSMPRSTSPEKQESQGIHYAVSGSRHGDGSDLMHTMQVGEEPELQQRTPAEGHWRVDLTLADTPGKLSQESLAVEVEGDASPVSSQKVQDQRALQQLQFLNNSAEPLTMSGACNKRSIQLSQDKDLTMSSVPYQGVVAQLSRIEDCLGPLDNIIEDTDSDVEGLVQ